MPFTPRKISDNFDKLPFHEDEKALLRRCLETPWDDAPLLIYADWVEEHGEEERADFIREQVRTKTDSHRGLTPQGVQAWRQALLFRGATKLDLYRGLPTKFSLNTVLSFSTDELSLIEQIPWDWCAFLRISKRISGIPDEFVAEVLSDSRLRQIYVLEMYQGWTLGEGYRDHLSDFESNQQNSNEFDFITDSPYTGNISQLSFAGCVRVNQLTKLNNSPLAEGLTSLSFKDLFAFPVTAFYPFESLVLPNLTHLKIRLSESEQTCCESLFSASYLKQLRSLDLSSIDTDWEVIFSGSTQFLQLEHLRLAAIKFDEQGLRALNNSTGIPIKSLTLSDCAGLSSPALQTFFQSPMFKQLELLKLSGMTLKGSPFKEKRKLSVSSNLQILDLSNCTLSKAALIDFINSPILESLNELILPEIGDIEMYELLANRQSLSGLRSIKLPPSAGIVEYSIIQNSRHFASCRLSFQEK